MQLNSIGICLVVVGSVLAFHSHSQFLEVGNEEWYVIAREVVAAWRILFLSAAP